MHRVRDLPLLYEEEVDKYFHPAYDEEYVIFQSRGQFFQIREQTQYANAVKKEEERIKDIIEVAERSPIYYDQGVDKYFYPEIALMEELYVPRKIIGGTHPLKWDGKRESWVHPQSR